MHTPQVENYLSRMIASYTLPMSNIPITKDHYILHVVDKKPLKMMEIPGKESPADKFTKLTPVGELSIKN